MKEYPYTAKRTVATLIDYVLIWALTFAYTIYFGELLPDGTHQVHGLLALPIFGMWFLYFVVGERYGGTLGHRLFRLKVVTMDGGQPSLGRTFLRRLFDIIDLGLVGLLLIRVSPYHQRLGDMVAKTQVIGQNDTLNPIEFDFEKQPS